MKPGIKNIENLSAVFGSVEFRASTRRNRFGFLTWENNVSMDWFCSFTELIEEFKAARKIIRRKNAYCGFQFAKVKLRF
jgi:hypothetical protein